jgi:biotin transport system substrate-specific component
MTEPPLHAPLAAGTGRVDPRRIVVGALLTTLAIAVAACIAVPLPGGVAPFTLQTLAVLLATPLAGLRSGTLGVALYLLAGAAGAPVFADGRGGLDVFAGPTAGFLVAFLLVAPTTGLVRRVVGRASTARWFAVFLAAHAAVLVIGFGWLLAAGAGLGVFSGLPPLLPGLVLKSMLAAAVVHFVLPAPVRARDRDAGP